MALLSFVDSAPRAYRLKASNAYRIFSTEAGTSPTFAVLVIGMAYGWRLGGLTLLAYLAEGALGLPVFAGGAGLAYMAGPTGGYLAGFVVAATLVGWLGEQGWDRSVVLTLVAMTLGTVVVFGLGIAWLTVLIGFEPAIANGGREAPVFIARPAFSRRQKLSEMSR
jgi:biotin transporter BioY